MFNLTLRTKYINTRIMQHGREFKCSIELFNLMFHLSIFRATENFSKVFKAIDVRKEKGALKITSCIRKVSTCIFVRYHKLPERSPRVKAPVFELYRKGVVDLMIGNLGY